MICCQIPLQFKHGFMSILQSRYANRRVFANQVYGIILYSLNRYNEYISDKHHVHMNGTCWTTLSQFVQSLANSGVCEIEESERVILVVYGNPQGWYITLIKQDTTERRKKERELEMAKNSLDTQERTIKHFEEERKKMIEKMDSSQLQSYQLLLILENTQKVMMLICQKVQSFNLLKSIKSKRSQKSQKC